eukprot:3568906-Pyramimonas_sp.AAC.1
MARMWQLPYLRSTFRKGKDQLRWAQETTEGLKAARGRANGHDDECDHGREREREETITKRSYASNDTWHS